MIMGDRSTSRTALLGSSSTRARLGLLHYLICMPSRAETYDKTEPSRRAEGKLAPLGQAPHLIENMNGEFVQGTDSKRELVAYSELS